MDLPEPVPPLLSRPANSLSRNVDSQPVPTTSNETLRLALICRSILSQRLMTTEPSIGNRFKATCETVVLQSYDSSKLSFVDVFLFASLLGFLSTLSLKQTDGQGTYTWFTETPVSMILAFAHGAPSRVEEGPICDADGCTVWRIPLGSLLDWWRKSMTMVSLLDS